MSNFTKHSKIRAQQRGIPRLILDWLMDYGTVKRRHGADLYSFDHKSRKALRREIGNVAYNRIADLLNAYVVVSDEGAVITTGWRTKKLRGS
jgi:hypothetical protein